MDKNESANIIEPYVSETRKEICSFLSPYLGDSLERFGQIIETSKAHTSGINCYSMFELYFNLLLLLLDIIDIVRNDQNQTARATFITSAAFFGYLIGRKGFFRRTLFAAFAAGSAAAICEPKMAKDYAEVTLDLAKQKFTECYKEYGINIFFFNYKLI